MQQQQISVGIAVLTLTSTTATTKILATMNNVDDNIQIE